jgi:RTX calcium-binding nonapeptide repeat (4 copies)
MRPLLSAMAGRTRLLAILLGALVAASSLSFASASGDVSHVGWPHTVTVAFADNSGQNLVGTDGNDLLLGGDGSDHIYGGPGNDIIWGDRLPSPNGPDQTDWLYGGSGDNWIYASHGTNHIFTGPDDNRVFAYFGRGTIVCGPGNDVVTLSKSSFHNYTVENCNDVTIGYP